MAAEGPLAASSTAREPKSQGTNKGKCRVAQVVPKVQGGHTGQEPRPVLSPVQLKHRISKHTAAEHKKYMA